MNKTLLTLTINDREKSFDCSGSERLSALLRSNCGLTGTKIGCHAGDCGACTVLLDDQQVCACLVPASQLSGARVTTVEALAALKKPDGTAIGARLAKAFALTGASQCGICTPGMLMAAAELLLRQDSPTREQVLDAIGGVLCRCTGYLSIVEAIKLAGSTKDVDSFYESIAPAGQAVGARISRLDVAGKLDGSALYGADFVVEDALDLHIVRSPYARARFRFGDLAAWQARHPGIAGFVTAADIPNNQFSIFAELRDQPALAVSETRFVGEAVLAVAGSARALAALADDPVPVSFQAMPPISDMQAATAPGAHPVQARYPDNILCRGHVHQPGSGTQTPTGLVQVSGQMQTAYLEHAYIEPDVGYACWHEPGGEFDLTVVVSTQTPYMDRDEIAWMFELPCDRVRVVPSTVGGGFGGKLDMAVQPLVVAAARKLNLPVRLVMERPDAMVATTKRHPSAMSATLSADASGRFGRFVFSGDFNTGAYASWGPTVANRVPIHASGPYRYESVLADTRAILTNDSVSGAFRGFGVPQAALLTESLIDELAEQLDIDPLALRLQNAMQAGDKTPTGQTLTASVGMVACLEALQPAWEASLAEARIYNRQASAVMSGELSNQAGPDRTASPLNADPSRWGQGTTRRGVGIACMWYGIGNTVIANPSTMTVGLRPTGRFMLYNGAVDIGQGTYTVMPQMCADALGAPVALFDQIYADTGLTEDGGKSSASRQTFVSGNAARLAGRQLRELLCRQLGVSVEAVLQFDGPLVKGIAGTRVAELDLRTLPRDQNGDVLLGRGYFNPPTQPLDEHGQGVPYATYGFAAQLAVVEVDLELGSTRVVHIHAAHDVGRAINPTLVEGQIHGGIAQGLGLALMEEYKSGVTDNLHDYLIPTAGDMPAITTYLIEDAEPLGPYGAKGVGEPALVATAPAILNAIRHATGAKLTQVPVTPDRLLAALGR